MRTYYFFLFSRVRWADHRPAWADRAANTFGSTGSESGLEGPG